MPPIVCLNVCIGLGAGKPFMFVGMNSIFFYMCHELFEKFFPFHYPDCAGENCSHASSIAMAVMGVCSWVIVTYWLWRWKIFYTV